MIPKHEHLARRFVVTTEAGEAVLEYEFSGDKVVFTHTFVPPELRGKGVGEILVRSALQWVRQEKRPYEARCSYVVRFLEKNPELR